MRFFTASPWPLTLLALAAHTILGAALPLIEDETYYRLWATAPDWGNYDHPPMIAWFIALGELILPPPLGTRAVSLLAVALVTPLVWRMAALLGGAAAGFWAGLFWNGSWLVLSVGSFATPDAPLMLFWAVALWAVVEGLSGGSRAWWALAGLALGLAVQSKLIAVFLALGLVGWGLTTAQGRRVLFGPALALVAIPVALVVAPYVAWNIATDWSGLERQLSRVAPGSFSLTRPLEYVAGLVLLFSPFAVWLVWPGLRAMRLRALWLWTAAPLAAYMLWHSLQHTVEANWMVPLHVQAAVAAGIGAARLRPVWPRISALASIGVGVPLFLWLMLSPAPLSDLHNPPNQLRGWTPVEDRITAAMAETGAAWIATTDYGLTGQMWHRLGDRWPVHAVIETRRYLFRPFPPALCDTPALLVERAGSEPLALFTTSDFVDEVLREDDGIPLDGLRLSLVRGLADCPP